MSHIIEVDSIQLELNYRNILSDIYLKCETGKITGLLGRNGQGKSCLMKIICGVMQCEKSVRFNKLTQHSSLIKNGVLVYLPQFNFIPKSLSLKRIFADYNLDYSAFAEAFPELSNNYKSPVHRLSGGGLRLVEIYILIKSSSYFAMLDEPFTHLNPIQIEKVKKLMLIEKVKKGLLITDHMYKHVMDISDYIYVLSDGKMHLINQNEDIETLGYARI